MIKPTQVLLARKDDLHALPQFFPLLAAVLAPLSTLLDIPAYTEHWFYTTDGTSGELKPLADPHTNLALSLVGLIFNIIANGLLIVRFSVGSSWWKVATRVSLACWLLKFGIALGNVLVFGILSRNQPGISYGEGFWCAVLSMLVATVIAGLLTIHYWHEISRHKGEDPTENQVQVRIAGRHFMLQTTLFVVTVGLLALFMSRLEHWTYLQGIYFAIVAFLTVGFGDFYPTKAVTQSIFFFFALIGIVQLASIVELIIRFFRERLESHNIERRHEFQKKRHEEEIKLEDEPSLETELAFLKQIFEETSQGKAMQDLATSVAGFLSFWLLGATIFSQIEGWTYGQGLYFCYIFFFTIGFGDYAPITPAGRVVFIMYSIIAVPIMSSFAIQTVQSIFQAASQNLFRRQEAVHDVGVGGVNARVDMIARGEDQNEDEEKRLPDDAKRRLERNDWDNMYRMEHRDFVAEEHRKLDERLSKSRSALGAKHDDTGKQGKDKGEQAEENALQREHERDLEREREEDRVLTEYILELAVELEKHARRLIMGHMSEDCAGNLLLRADRLVQLRNVRALAGREEFPVRADGDGKTGNAEAGEKSGESSSDSEKPLTSAVAVSSQSSTSDSGTNTEAQQETPSSHATTMMRKYYSEEADLVPFPTGLDERETLEEVARYREAFAGLLAAGSRLLRLKDRERALFERRYWRDGDGDAGSEK